MYLTGEKAAINCMIVKMQQNKTKPNQIEPHEEEKTHTQNYSKNKNENE